jgi:hypothetical protein
MSVPEPIVVVSGLPRSGTSMMMRMLEAGGLPVVADGRRSADDDNPLGYFEDERVKALASDPDRSWVAEARGKAIKVISRLLPELPSTETYKVVFMRRELDEVLASQARMLERRGLAAGAEDGRIRALFEKDLERTQELLRRAPHMQALEVRYSEVVRAPREAAERVAQFLGRDLDTELMAGAVSASLYRNRSRT